MALNEYVEIAGAFVAVASLIFSGISFYLTLRLRRELSLHEKFSHVPGLLHDEYLNRKTDRKVKLPNGLETDAVEVIRDYVRQNKKEYFGAFEGPTTDRDSWQFVFAEEIAHALQDTGIAVIAGALPLPFVMADAACVILEDYSYSKPYLDRWRMSGPETLNSSVSEDVAWSRRHGEWIVQVAVIYLNRFWNGERVCELLESCKLKVSSCLVREQSLRLADWRLCSPSLEREMLSLRRESLLARTFARTRAALTEARRRIGLDAEV